MYYYKESHRNPIRNLVETRACTAKRRATETPEETLCRQEHNRACTAKKRACESSEDNFQRKQSNKTTLANKRKSSISIDSYFHLVTKLGPEFRGSQGNHMLVPHFFLKLYRGPHNTKKKKNTQYVRVVLHKTCMHRMTFIY